MNLLKTHFETERMVFKEINEADMDDIFTLNSMPEVDEFNTIGIPENIEITRKVYRPSIEDQSKEKRSLFCWTIRHKESGIFMGIAGLTLSAERFKMGEIYYNFAPAHWGKGYGTETAKALIQFGFETLKLHRVDAGVATENKRSIRVLEKSGMIREGLHRKILPIRGQWKDNYHYSILEDDPR